MTHLVRPFAALRPRRETAQAVVAPPYDVVDESEARELAAGRPESFLHISRPEIDLPEGTDPHDDAVYAKGAANLARLVDSGVLEREQAPCYYAWRMTMGAHSQTGIAVAASVAAYESGRIHRHELTRPDKEDDRVRNIESLNAQTGPVLLAYKAEARIDDLLAKKTAGAPLFEVEGQHGVRHALWRLDAPADIERLTTAFDALGHLYIADGHHRSAAAARVAAARRPHERGGQAKGGQSPISGPSPIPGKARQNRSDPSAAAEGNAIVASANHEYFLSVAFPDDQMQVFDYNRVVADLNGLDAAGFLKAVERSFRVEPFAGRARPESPRQFGLYLGGRWYRLTATGTRANDDPVARLDVSILQNRVIGSILGVRDPRTDARIGFVGGVRGLEELERRVDSGKAAVAFALYPTSMRDLMSVADAGLLMPPKSTWFEPKLADGLLSHVLD